MHMDKSLQKKYYFEQSVRMCFLVLLIWIIIAIKVPAAAGKPVKKYENVKPSKIRKVPLDFGYYNNFTFAKKE